MPHEPVLLYYGRYYSALTVAVVAVISTVIAEGINYSVFGYVSDTKLFDKMRRKKSVERIITLFNKAPFTAIIVAGFTPVPFFPIRFLVVMGRYPLIKYLLGVFVSRAPRFYILAYAGYVFKIPLIVLAALFLLMIIFVNIPLVKKILVKED